MNHPIYDRPEPPRWQHWAWGAVAGLIAAGILKRILDS